MTTAELFDVRLLDQQQVIICKVCFNQIQIIYKTRSNNRVDQSAVQNLRQQLKFLDVVNIDYVAPFAPAALGR